MKAIYTEDGARALVEFEDKSTPQEFRFKLRILREERESRFGQHFPAEFEVTHNRKFSRQSGEWTLTTEDGEYIAP